MLRNKEQIKIYVLKDRRNNKETTTLFDAAMIVSRSDCTRGIRESREGAFLLQVIAGSPNSSLYSRIALGAIV